LFLGVLLWGSVLIIGLTILTSSIARITAIL
jgi:hypothetical protein